MTVASAPEQQLRHRLAEQVGASDHDRAGSGELHAGLLKQDHHPDGRARAQAGQAQGQTPGVEDAEPIDVLVGIDASGQSVGVEVVGDGQLAEDAADRRVGVELVDDRQRLGLINVGGELAVHARDPDLRARAVLAGDVDAPRPGRRRSARWPGPAGARARRRTAATSAATCSRRRAAIARPSMIVARHGRTVRTASLSN